jgi:lipid II:glycine glycyltransferase (peptidoglycan interpeptide bridge formation enzyme)
MKNMEFRTVSDKKIITDFLITSAADCGAEFLVSKEWADILQTEENVETLGVYDGEKLSALFNLIKKDFKFGLSYYYLPRGPVFAKDLSAEKQSEIWQLLISEFKSRRGIFLRVEPKDFLPSNIKALPSINLQPKETLMLDLSLSEEELLKSFHQKTRYNIRLAEKKGVVVREGQGEKDFVSFWSLMTETGKRDNFHIHNQNHYHLLATANPDFIKLFIAEIDGQTIAAGLFSFFGDKATYLHGASAHEFRQLMAPYLLQWTLIKTAKESGYKYYDFYGIDAKKWPGVTRFKTGFGGFTVSYAGTCDIILNPFTYALYNILRRIRRLI